MIPIRGLRAPVRDPQPHRQAQGSAARIGAPRCNWTDEMDAELLRLWKAREPASAIAARMGLTRAAVFGRADRLGLQRRVGVSV